MPTLEVITTLCSEVDERMRAIPKHPEAHLWPSEVITLGLWLQRSLEPPLDGRRETLSGAELVGGDRGVGVCHRSCGGYHLPVAEATG